MDVVRLELIRDYVIELRRLDPPDFSMDSWNCGTSKCVMGHAGFDERFQQLGFFTLPSDFAKYHTQGQVKYVRGNEVFYGFDAVARFFDIPEEKANYLFGSSPQGDYPPAETFNEVLVRVEEVLKGEF